MRILFVNHNWSLRICLPWNNFVVVFFNFGLIFWCQIYSLLLISDHFWNPLAARFLKLHLELSLVNILVGKLPFDKICTFPNIFLINISKFQYCVTHLFSTWLESLVQGSSILSNLPTFTLSSWFHAWSDIISEDIICLTLSVRLLFDNYIVSQRLCGPLIVCCCIS